MGIRKDLVYVLMNLNEQKQVGTDGWSFMDFLISFFSRLFVIFSGCDYDAKGKWLFILWQTQIHELLYFACLCRWYLIYNETC